MLPPSTGLAVFGTVIGAGLACSSQIACVAHALLPRHYTRPEFTTFRAQESQRNARAIRGTSENSSAATPETGLAVGEPASCIRSGQLEQPLRVAAVDLVLVGGRQPQALD